MSEKTTLDKAVKISIIASVLIFSLAVAYYLIVFIPQKEQNKAEDQRKKDEEVANARKDCAIKAMEEAKKTDAPDYDLQYNNCLSSKGIKD